MKTDETNITIALNDTKLEENTNEELNNCQLLVTETNTNATAAIESSDISLLPNVDKHTMNTSVKMEMY